MEDQNAMNKEQEDLKTHKKIGYQEKKNIKLRSKTSKLKTNQISEIKI